jgi:hypothetical protein
MAPIAESRPVQETTQWSLSCNCISPRRLLARIPHRLREAGLPFDLKRTDVKTKKLEDGSDYFAVNSKGCGAGAAAR